MSDITEAEIEARDLRLQQPKPPQRSPSSVRSLQRDRAPEPRPQPEPPADAAPAPAETGQPEPPKEGNPQPPKAAWFHRPVPVLILALLFVAASVGGMYYYVHASGREETDDAFIDAHVAQVGPKVAGRVLKVHAEDNQLVKAGDLLVSLDPRDLQAALQARRAATRNAIARQRSAQTAFAEAKAHIETLSANVAETRANAISVESDARRANADLQRFRRLIASGAISRQEFEHSETGAQAANAQVEAARKKISAAEAQITEGKASVASSQAQIEAATADVEQAKAAEAAAELDVSYTQIVAPDTGRVTNRSVEPGNYVQVGQALMAIVPANLWATANFKENQIAEMQPGQHASIKIDAYPGREFRGHVDSIQRGSGAQFSLLPPENATGNYVKVVQRVPVKIMFDEALPGGKALGPGMSVVPTVTIHEIKDPVALMVAAGVISGLVAGIGSWVLLRRRKSPASAAGQPSVA